MTKALRIKATIAAHMAAIGRKGGSVTGPCKARDSKAMRAAARKRWAGVLSRRTAAAVEQARRHAMKRAKHAWDRADKRKAAQS